MTCRLSIGGQPIGHSDLSHRPKRIVEAEFFAPLRPKSLPPSGNFTAPEEACPTFHAFYDGLREFEQDLHRHIHLGNNILFPRAVAMEAGLEEDRQQSA